MISRHRRVWTEDDWAIFRRMAGEGYTLPAIAYHLERSERAISAKASRHHIQIKPVRRRQSPLACTLTLD